MLNTLGRVSVFVTILILVNPSSRAFQNNQGSADALFSAYGYLIGQDELMDKVVEQFPEKTNQINFIRTKFKYYFGDARTNVDRKLEEIFGPDEKIEQVKVNLKNEVIKSLSGRVFVVDELPSVFALLVSRAEGNLEIKGVAQTLLALKYQNNPESEFSFRPVNNEFRAHSKAPELSISIQTPFSWAMEESRLPNILANWKPNAGFGSGLASIEVHRQPGMKVNEKKIRDDIKKGRLPSPINFGQDSRHYGAAYTEISRLPSVTFFSELSRERLGNVIFVKSLSVAAFFQENMIVLNCGFGGLATEKEKIMRSFDLHLDACRLFINSLIVENAFLQRK